MNGSHIASCVIVVVFVIVGPLIIGVIRHDKRKFLERLDTAQAVDEMNERIPVPKALVVPCSEGSFHVEEFICGPRPRLVVVLSATFTPTIEGHGNSQGCEPLRVAFVDLPDEEGAPSSGR